MADNIIIKDANGDEVILSTTDDEGVQIPHQIIDEGSISISGPVTIGTPLPAGTNSIGTVAIGSSIPAGTNNIGDVDLASPLPAGTNLIGEVKTYAPSYIVYGHKYIAVAGTAEVLTSANELFYGVTIKANHTNTGLIYVGGSFDVGSSTGFPLAKGEEIFIRINNPALIYINAGVSGESVRYIGS